MPLASVIRVPLDRPNVTLAIHEIPAITAAEGATLVHAVSEAIASFRNWYGSLSDTTRAATPPDSAGIIFLHTKADVETVVDFLNSTPVALLHCTCYKDCNAGEGCRIIAGVRAVAYHSGMPQVEKTAAFNTDWAGGEDAVNGSCAFWLVSSPAAETGTNRPHVLAAIAPCGPPPSLSSLAQGVWGRTMRSGTHPAYASVVWNYRLFWRCIYRSNAIEFGSPEFYELNRVIRFCIRGLGSCPRKALLLALSCPVPAAASASNDCHDHCCSYGTRGAWGSRNGGLLRDVTARTMLFVDHVLEAAKAPWFPHAGFGKVAGFNAPVPKWREGLTECETAHLLDSFFAPEDGLATIAYVYRPTNAWCLCVGIHAAISANNPEFYHLAAY